MTATLAAVVVAAARSPELTLVFKATVVLLLGLGAASLARRARASIRHLALAATFVAMIALPLAAVSGPAIVIRLPIASRAIDASAATVPASSSLTERALATASSADADRHPWLAGPSPAATLRTVWLAGAATWLGALAAGLWRLRRLRREALPLSEFEPLVASLARESGVASRIEVLEHERVPSPLTFGVWRPVILLPPDARGWTDAALRRALVHEIEHVRRLDWTLQVAAKAVTALYWFHPLVWLASRRLYLEAERACDDAVVRGGERMEYADQLVLLARRMSGAQPAAMVGMAVRSDLTARVNALLDDTQRRGRVGVAAAVSAALVSAAVVAAVAPIRAVGVEEQSGRRNAAERRVRGIDRAIYEAAENGDLNEIDDLIHQGANVNAAIDGDGSPLIAAARTARVAVARHLLDRGADPNLPVPGDGSPLIAAATVGAINVVALLLDRGAAIDQVVPDDENALIQACAAGHLEVVKLLVARGANLHARVWAQQGQDTRNGEYRTPLSAARRGRNPAVVAYLLSVGASE